MGKIQKVQNQTQVGVFEALFNKHESLNDRQPEMKKESSRSEEKKVLADQRREEWQTADGNNLLRHNNPSEIDLVRKGNSIRSARCASNGITNEKGSGKYVGSSKSQLPTSTLDNAIQALTSKEVTAQEKAASSELRTQKQAEYRAAHSPRLGENEESMDRTANIQSYHTEQSSRYTAPSGKISIFDNEDFERIADSTMERREVKKDDSWKAPKKAYSSKDATDKLMNDLTSSDSSDYKSLQKESANRIYEALKSNLNKDA